MGPDVRLPCPALGAAVIVVPMSMRERRNGWMAAVFLGGGMDLSLRRVVFLSPEPISCGLMPTHCHEREVGKGPDRNGVGAL